jgi:hypothetical protein
MVSISIPISFLRTGTIEMNIYIWILPLFVFTWELVMILMWCCIFFAGKPNDTKKTFLYNIRIYKGSVIKWLLGWAGVIWDGPWKIFGQFRYAANLFVCPPNKNPCMSTSKNKDINNKSKQNYPNYQMQMTLLKPVLCLYNNKKWSNHSKYNQLESSSVS